MYEVFSNGKRIIIGQTRQANEHTDGCKSIGATELNHIKARVFSYLTSAEESPLQLDYPTEALWTHFRNWFEPIMAAGGVVQSEKGLLFILKNRRWDLPKGKVEKGEKIESAAIREVKEETGAKGVAIVKPLRDTWHIYKTQNEHYMLKQTFWFLMEASAETTLQPDCQENIEKVVWIARSEVPEVAEIAWSNLKSLILEALEG